MRSIPFILLLLTIIIETVVVLSLAEKVSGWIHDIGSQIQKGDTNGLQ